MSFVTPNLLVFSVIPHTGAGYAGLMFALSPVFTALLAALFGLRTSGRLGWIGIAVGLIGATIVSLTRGTAFSGDERLWLLAALMIPIALAIGNVYRTLDWPDGVVPNVLAFWGHAFAALVFVLLLATRGGPSFDTLAPVAGPALIQVLVSGATFPFFFRLQKIGGPVLLSQIGYVAAAVGLIATTALLGERYSGATWVGAIVIALGIVTTVFAQTRDR